MGSGVAASAFSDANGWSRPEFYQSLWVADVNADGEADICGRGYDGISCQLSMTNKGNIAFRPPMQWVSNFGDNYGWGALESHWGTVQAGKTAPFVHDATNTSFCGRGYDGIWCSNP